MLNDVMSDEYIREIECLKDDLQAERNSNRLLRHELTALNEPLTNPFKCGHAARFIWTTPSGNKICTACRMFAAERLEKELAVALENCTILDREAQEHLDRLGY